MNESERIKVLELLEQGKITAAEAAELLNALGAASGERGPGRAGSDGGRRERGRWERRGGWGGAWSWDGEGDMANLGRARVFRVRVTDTATGKVRANVSIPIGI